MKEKDKESFSLMITMPRDLFEDDDLKKLRLILASKEGLIKKALGVKRLTVKATKDEVSFPWFDRVLTADEANTYTELVSKLCQMAKEQKRVLNKKTTTDNEKYSFRTFLLRLGFIGDAHKLNRKILLQNLEGSSAFRHEREVENV